jgi:hypothetical protein
MLDVRSFWQSWISFGDDIMPEQLLFIGHSLVGYKMPEMFNSFMNTLGVDAQADRQVINGSPLRFNWALLHKSVSGIHVVNPA